MGYWGIGIMDGDGPADLFYNITEYVVNQASVDTQATMNTIAETIYNTAEDNPTLQAEYDAMYVELLSGPNLPNKMYQDIDAIIDGRTGHDEGVQVLGVHFMERGIPLPAGMKKELLQICKRDDWSNDNDKRRVWMNNFITQVKEYDGTSPVTIMSIDLFTALSQSTIYTNS
jgi:hypothetical protein